MKQSKIKTIVYGGDPAEHFQVRAQGQRVRMQDMDTGELYMLQPFSARKLAKALTYAAKHAEIIKLTPELEKALNELRQSNPDAGLDRVDDGADKPAGPVPAQ